jgi:protein-L-isoaspartate O-methyltransferase
MPEKAQRDLVKEIERELVGARIPGFFPTPKTLAKRMVELADVGPGELWLEPSAGSGNLAEAIGEAGANVVCVEYNFTLCRLLRAKGFERVHNEDFLKCSVALGGDDYAGAIMNPPFENGQDIEHVRHAYNQIRNGGVLVAIMSNGPFFRQDKQAAEFRAWLETVNLEHEEDLLAGTFNHRDVTQRTGISAKLLVIRKRA